MKSERRHELKINTLDDALAKMHAQWRQYATWAVTAVIVGVLVGVLVHNRIAASQARAQRAADDLAVAREDIQQIQMQITAGQAAATSEFYRDCTGRLDSILANAGSDRRLAAEALVARGDLDWYMSAAAGATTQPLLDQPGAPELQKGAQAAYEQVIQTYPEIHFSVNSARMGLAAIAENNHDWAEASRDYQNVLDDPNAGDLMQTMARGMLGGVDRLQNPPLIGAIPATPLTAGPSGPPAPAIPAPAATQTSSK